MYICLYVYKSLLQPIDSPDLSNKPLLKNSQIGGGQIGGGLHTTMQSTDINGHSGLNSGMTPTSNSRPSSASVAPAPIIDHSTVTYHRDSCWVMFAHCLRGNQQYRHFKSLQKTGTLSVSKIDMLSRIIFPFSFTCLNILYWAGFIYYF